MRKSYLFTITLAFAFSFSIGHASASDHCLQFTDTPNQLCIGMRDQNQAEVWFKSLGDTKIQIADGELHFVTWSRADHHSPFELPPPNIRNLAPPKWGRETINGLSAIRFALIGIGDQVFWIKDNGLIDRFDIDPSQVQKIDYSSPNQQDLPAVGAEMLRAQLAHEFYQTYTFVSKGEMDPEFHYQHYTEDHLLVRFSDGNYLHFGPFVGDVKAIRTPILKDYEHLTRHESMGLSLTARVEGFAVQYEIDLGNFWAMLTEGKEAASIARVIKPTRSASCPDTLKKSRQR